MLLSIIVAASAAPAVPSDLTVLRDTSLPGSGLASALSADGDTLFVAHGASVAEIDVDQVRDWLVAEENGHELSEVLGDVHPVEAPIMDMIEHDGSIYVAGGDYGIFEISSTGAVTAFDAQAGGRWCFDLELSGDYLVAIWGGLNRTQVRTYDLTTTPPPERTVNINIAGGLQVAAIGRALELYGDYAYLAMGSAGLVRVRWQPGSSTTLEQGPDFYPGPTCTDSTEECERQYRVRDVAIASHYLYAAADREGLVEIDLDDTWGPNVDYWSERPTSTELDCDGSADDDYAYAVRVDAVHDTSVTPQRVVIAVGGSRRPSSETEWGPFFPYSGFTWRLETPEVAGDIPVGCVSTSLFVYDRRVDGPTPNVAGAVEVERAWHTLALQKADGRYWVYNQEFRVWHIERDGSGALGALLDEDDEVFYPPKVSYSGPALSLGDPALVLCAADGGGTGTVHRIEESGSDLVLEPVPGTEDQDFKLSISIGAQWWEADPPTAWEWLAASSAWAVARFQGDPDDPDSIVSTWQTWRIEKQPDPITGETGRSYGCQGVDHRSVGGILALGITEQPRAVSLYRRDEILTEVSVSSPLYGSILDVLPLGFLNIHPEVGCTPTDDEIGDMYCLELEYFPWSDGEGERAVLVVAAGFDPESSDPNGTFEHPKLVFVDLEDCNAPNYDCSALFDPMLACDYVDPNLFDIVYLPDRYGMAFAVDVATIEGKQYAFVCDTASRVTAYELTDLFGSGPEHKGSWRMPVSNFDGLREVLTDIEIVFEDSNGGPGTEPMAYVAACRGGVQKLAIEVVTDPQTQEQSIDFTPVVRINTPGQASKLAIRTIDVDESTQALRMIVADHDDLGVKLYGD